MKYMKIIMFSINIIAVNSFANVPEVKDVIMFKINVIIPTTKAVLKAVCTDLSCQFKKQFARSQRTNVFIPMNRIVAKRLIPADPKVNTIFIS